MSLILGKHINQNLGMKFYEHILKLSTKFFFDNRKVGEISSKISGYRNRADTVVKNSFNCICRCYIGNCSRLYPIYAKFKYVYWNNCHLFAVYSGRMDI